MKVKKSTVQSVLFDKRKLWTKYTSLTYLNLNGKYPIKPVHETKNFYRYRLEDPNLFSRFRIKKLQHGIKFVIGFY